MIKTLLMICCALCLCAGCAVGKQTVSGALDIAYANGGAVLVSQKIDKLVIDGKITENQAVVLKYAAQKSYEQLQTKLSELEVKDAVVE